MHYTTDFLLCQENNFNFLIDKSRQLYILYMNSMIERWRTIGHFDIEFQYAADL